MPSAIFLLTDFGTSDPFVGIMKAVMHGINPSIPLIDLSHEVPAGDIRIGAITLWQSLPYLPEKSVVLCVVDPGVGTLRRAILLKTRGYSFVGPDNGVFTYILGDGFKTWELRNPELSLPARGTTFHGRDIFAPAAAHVASGVPSERFGPPLKDLVRIPEPQLSCRESGQLVGEVIHIDHFGNALTSLGTFTPVGEGSYDLEPWVGDCSKARFNLRQAEVRLPSRADLGWAEQFAGVPLEGCGFIVGSSGLIEIVANRQSAAKLLDLATGTTVTLNT